MSVPVVEEVMDGRVPIAVHVRRRAEPLVMVNSLSISIRPAGDGLCLNGCRSRRPGRCDGDGVRVGCGVVGLISFQGIVRSTVPLAVALRGFVGDVVMDVLVLVGRLR